MFHMMTVNAMQVFLEGELERGIVPLESAWMHGRGCGEDGCLLMLQKMNLEVLQKWAHAMHALCCYVCALCHSS